MRFFIGKDGSLAVVLALPPDSGSWSPLPCPLAASLDRMNLNDMVNNSQEFGEEIQGRGLLKLREQKYEV
jgi:hypothetical protein